MPSARVRGGCWTLTCRRVQVWCNGEKKLMLRDRTFSRRKAMVDEARKHVLTEVFQKVESFEQEFK